MRFVNEEVVDAHLPESSDNAINPKFRICRTILKI